MHSLPRFGKFLSAPLAWLLVLNVGLPWLGSAMITTAFQPSSQRQVVYWLAVILLFTFNQIAARKWRAFRWAFWSISTLNLLAIPMGGLAFATIAHSIPSVVLFLLRYD